MLVAAVLRHYCRAVRISCCLLLLLGACSRDAGPEEALSTWYAALATGETGAVWDGISSASQARLQHAAEAWERGDDDALAPHTPAPDKPDGEDVLRHWISADGMLPPLPADPVKLVGAMTVVGNEASCSVRGPYGALQVRLVLEDGAWRVLMQLP